MDNQFQIQCSKQHIRVLFFLTLTTLSVVILTSMMWIAKLGIAFLIIIYSYYQIFKVAKLKTTSNIMSIQFVNHQEVLLGFCNNKEMRYEPAKVSGETYITPWLCIFRARIQKRNLSCMLFKDSFLNTSDYHRFIVKLRY